MRLDRLCQCHNNLTSLPESITKLAKLKNLYANNNKLTEKESPIEKLIEFELEEEESE